MRVAGGKRQRIPDLENEHWVLESGLVRPKIQAHVYNALKCSYLHTNHTGFIPGVLNRSSKKWIIPNRVGPGFCYTTTDVHNGTTLHNNGSPDLIFILEGGVHGYMYLCTLGDVCNHATFKPIQAPIAFFGTRKFSHRTASCDLVSCLRTYRKGSR